MTTTTDLTGDEALAADLARVRELADLSETDPLLVSVRETNLYRAALREAQTALEAAKAKVREYEAL